MHLLTAMTTKKELPLFSCPDFRKQDSELVDLLATADRNQLPPLFEAAALENESSIARVIREKFELESRDSEIDDLTRSRRTANLIVASFRNWKS